MIKLPESLGMSNAYGELGQDAKVGEMGQPDVPLPRCSAVLHDLVVQKSLNLLAPGPKLLVWTTMVISHPSFLLCLA